MKRFLLLALTCLIVLAGCQSGPTAQDILGKAAQNMTQAKSLKFTIERTGPPVQVKLGNTSVGVTGADGAYQAPDKVYAKVKAQVAGLVTEGEVLWQPSGPLFKHPML